MSPSSPADAGRDEHAEPHRLVCGLCQAPLDGVHPDQARADEAADDHARHEHPEHESVVVLAVPMDILDARREDVLAIATAAQRRVSQRPDEDPGRA